MGRKYLNRTKNEEFDQDYEEEVTEKKKLERIGPNIEEIDPFEVQFRKIAIEKDLIKPIPIEEKIHEDIKEAGHKTRTVNQYQKIVNAHLEDRVSKIDKIKKAKQQFDEEINRLQGNQFDNIKQLTDVQVQNLSSKTMEDMLKSLILNRDITVSKLEHFRNRVKETEEELIQQEINIEKIRKEIQRKKEKEMQMEKDVDLIKQEISNLKNKYDIDELKKALDLLVDKNR